MGKTVNQRTVLIAIVAMMIFTLMAPVCQVKAAATTTDNIDVLIEATKEVLHDSFDDDFSVERGDNVVTINIWSDGIAYASIYATQNDAYRDDWNSLLSSLHGMSETIYSVYEPYGYSVVVNVLNDLNRENVLISYMNGVLIYDTVTVEEI